MNKLDIKDFPLVSGIIKDLPQNVIENHSLIQKHATVYHTGSIDNINSLVVKTGYDTGENKCYSSDMDDIIELLGYKGELAGFSINCPDSEYLINKYEKVYSRKLREYKVSSNVLNGSPKIKSEHAVLLSQKDKILLDKASEYFDWFGFKSSEEMLKAGFIAGIIEDDTLVSVAYTSSFSEKYMDIGIRTKKEYRGKGYATDSAAKLVEAALSLNKIPVWNVMDINKPSVSICRKLGFEHVVTESYFE